MIGLGSDKNHFGYLSSKIYSAKLNHKGKFGSNTSEIFQTFEHCKFTSYSHSPSDLIHFHIHVWSKTNVSSFLSLSFAFSDRIRSKLQTPHRRPRSFLYITGKPSRQKYSENRSSVCIYVASHPQKTPSEEADILKTLRGRWPVLSFPLIFAQKIWARCG